MVILHSRTYEYVCSVEAQGMLDVYADHLQGQPVSSRRTLNLLFWQCDLTGRGELPSLMELSTGDQVRLVA